MSADNRRSDLTPAHNGQAPGTGDSVSSSSDIFADWGASVRNFIWPIWNSDNISPYDPATTRTSHYNCSESGAQNTRHTEHDDVPTLTTCNSINFTPSSASTMSTLPPTTQSLLPSTADALPPRATEPFPPRATEPKPNAALQTQRSLRDLPVIPDITSACALPSTTTALPSTVALPCTAAVSTRVDKNKDACICAECGGNDNDTREEELQLELMAPSEEEDDARFLASMHRRDAVLVCRESPLRKSRDSSSRTYDSWRENDDVDDDELGGTTGASIHAKLTNYNEPGRLLHYNERHGGVVDSTRFGPRRKMDPGAGDHNIAHASPHHRLSAPSSAHHATRSGSPRMLYRNTDLLAVPTPASASTAYPPTSGEPPPVIPDSGSSSSAKTQPQSENRWGRRWGRLKVLTSVATPEGTPMRREKIAEIGRESVAEEISGGGLSPAVVALHLEIADHERRRAVTEHDVRSLRADLADKAREVSTLEADLVGARDVHALRADLTDKVREVSTLKAELLAAKTEASKWKEELARERRQKMDWVAKTEVEYNALLEDLALARAEHQRDNDTNDRHIEWLYNAQNLLQARLDLCAVTEKHAATIQAQEIVKRAVNVALTSRAFLDAAEKNVPAFVQQRLRKKLSVADGHPMPANRKTSNLFELFSRNAGKGNLIEGAYLIKNGKIADRYPLEKYDVLDHWTVRYVNGALNAEGTGTSSPEPLSYALLDELQQAQGPRTQFFVFSLLSTAKDAHKRPSTDEDKPVDILFGHCLIFPFVRYITDGDIACPGQTAVLGTMGIVLISRFPLLVLFRDLLRELFQCNYLQLDARLRRLFKGKRPDTMTWSDAARQLLRITYSQRRDASSCFTIAIPSYAGREQGGKLTHFWDDQLGATEMLGEILAPWNQYKSAFIEILTAFMLERKVTIISSDVRSGSVMCVALRALISPFVWLHVFQPSMPSSLVDQVPMMDAPFPFLVHLHSSSVPKDYPFDVVACTIEADSLTVVNAEKDVFPPKLLTVLRSTESVAQLAQVMGEATRELHAALTLWGKMETTQPMANSKGFLKKHKLPLFRSPNDEFLINFFKTQQCCDVVDSAVTRAT